MPATDMSRRIKRAEKDFGRWLKKNPGKKFRDYYVECVSVQLDAGQPHATLGKKLKGDLSWEESGLAVFEQLVESGLRPEHVCVDYGCGSLRIGQHLMSYLEPGHYWGLDVTDRFYKDGLELIGPEAIAQFRPNVRVIADAALDEVRACEPDFILSMAVLIHVPPPELDEMLDNLMKIHVGKTRAFMSYKAADDPVRYSGRSWAYPEDLLREKIGERGGVVEFRPRTSIENENLGITIRRGWLEITRPQTA